MADIILHRRSFDTGSVPTTASLGVAQFAINVPDGKVFIHKSSSIAESIISVVTTDSITTGSITLTGTASAALFIGQFSGSFTGVDTTLISSGSASAAVKYDANGSSSLQINTLTAISGALYVSLYSGSTPITGTSVLGTASFADTAFQAYTASFALTSSYVTQSALAFQSAVSVKAAMNILKGQIVHIQGADGTNLLVTTASYVSDALSANTLGVATSNINNNSTGVVVTEGLLSGLNTAGFVAGANLYLGVNGTFTTTRPQAPLHSVRVGYVTKVSAGNGEIYVRLDNGYELGELHDVVDNNHQIGDLLIVSNSVWYNSKQLTGSYGLTGSLSTIGSINLVGTQRVTGSVGITGSLTVVGAGITGSFTGSLVGTLTGSLTSSDAIIGTLTSSNAVLATAVVSGTFTVIPSSNLEFQVTSTGTKLGNAQTDTHQITGSAGITGSSFSVFTTGATPEFQVTSTGNKLGNVITDSHQITGSVSITGSSHLVGTQTITGSLRVALTASADLFEGFFSGSFSGSIRNAETASLARTASFVNSRYAREIHVSSGSGDDSGSGDFLQPFRTIGKAIATVLSGQQIIIHPGTYPENFNTPTNCNNVTITAANTEIGGLVNITGTASIDQTIATIRLVGLNLGSVIHSGNKSLYLQNCIIGGALTKSGNGYLEAASITAQSGLTSVTGTGQAVIINSLLGVVDVNNASALVNLSNNIVVVTPTCQAGTMLIDGGTVYSTGATTGAVFGSSGATVVLRNAQCITTAGGSARITLNAATLASIQNVSYDRANSTVGTSLSTRAHFQHIQGDAITGSGLFLQGNVAAGASLISSHRITGSVGITGSFTVFSRSNPEFQVLDNGTFIGNVQTDTHRITGSVGITGSLNVVGGGITGSLLGSVTAAETASFANSGFTINSSSLFSLARTSSAIGANTFTLATGSSRGSVLNYTVNNASNARTGQVMTSWIGNNIVYTETQTTDIGSTAGVTYTSSLSGANVVYTFGTTTAGWNIEFLVTHI